MLLKIAYTGIKFVGLIYEELKKRVKNSREHA